MAMSLPYRPVEESGSKARVSKYIKGTGKAAQVDMNIASLAHTNPSSPSITYSLFQKKKQEF